MDLIILGQQLVNGLVLGSIYGLIAVGYTMVYGIIGMINFAHGEVYMISAYLSAIFLAIITMWGVTSVPVVLLLVLFLTIFITALYVWQEVKISYKDKLIREQQRIIILQKMSDESKE